MPQFDLRSSRNQLQQFAFRHLFIEELGWSNPPQKAAQSWQLDKPNLTFTYQPIAELSGVMVLEVTTAAGTLPDAKTCAAIHEQLSQWFFENLLIFVNATRTQSLWYWVKRTEGKKSPRTHHYFKGQSGDLILSKLSAMLVDLSEFDEHGHINLVEVTRRLHNALDIEPITKKFYAEFKAEHLDLAEQIEGLANDSQRHWYASVLLHRLMFIYFLQKKGFLDNGNQDYLAAKLAQSRARAANRFYADFLTKLFFEGFALPPEKRSAEAKTLLGQIPYLNGGLFLPHELELPPPTPPDSGGAVLNPLADSGAVLNSPSESGGARGGLDVPDAIFERLFALFGRYSWNLDDAPGGHDAEINPDVLGYIFEKYINQKAFGAYYTRPEITAHLCEQTIHRLILAKINTPPLGQEIGLTAYHFDSIAELQANLDAPLCQQLLFEILPQLSLLDPACGSGAFLVAAMKTLINLYDTILATVATLHDPRLEAWRAQLHRNPAYAIRKKIITENLYGVDIMPEATEIARLRLFLALVATAHQVNELEPLPNIDFNIMSGNSLIGLLRIDERRFQQLSLFNKSYRQLVNDKQTLIRTYQRSSNLQTDLQALRDTIQQQRHEAQESLNELLRQDFQQLKIRFEEATWDAVKQKEGKPRKRDLTTADLTRLQPFHWGYEFDEILHERGGFDAIITNPPWEIFKPNGKEFLAAYSDQISKKKMSIKDFEEVQGELLQDETIRQAWFDYSSSYPHVSLYFRNAPQFVNQISVVNGKQAGTDINLYKLFVEQCFNLLRPGGACGIVVPSGLYTDLGTKQLRHMLFEQTEIQGLFCFENRRAIFEGVDSRFKFIVISFSKGGKTETFPAAFMRHEVAELTAFPQEGALPISVNLIRKLSPDSLSVMEFKTELDVQIAEKMLQFPLLGEQLTDTWNLKLASEFHMTNDSYLFRTVQGAGCLPLYEGKMMHQFDHRFSEPRYWVNEAEGRKGVLGKTPDTGQLLDYQKYRLGIRSIARNTDSRTLIVGPIPKNVMCGNSLLVLSHSKTEGKNPSDNEIVLMQGLLNSFVIDFYIRQMISANMNMFYIYQLPVPRLTMANAAFLPIVERSARLICTAPEFDDLARAVGLSGHAPLSPDTRAQLRAELDGLVAHLYGLTPTEFRHILSTFPLVTDEAKAAALRELEKQP